MVPQGAFPEHDEPREPRRSPFLQRVLESAWNLKSFVHQLLLAQAVHVAGTEAAAFLVQADDGSIGVFDGPHTLNLIDHVRPDDSDQQARRAAINVFKDLVAPCVEQGKDGAVEVGTPDEGDPQYCLITLLMRQGRTEVVTAVITRCIHMDRAKQRLDMMQIVAGYYELYELLVRPPEKTG